MRKPRQLLILLLIPSLLLGCLKTQEGSKETISTASVLGNSALTPTEKAEEIAKQAERLMTAQGFKETRVVVEEALKQDPSNFRALFIKSILGTLLPQKGIFKRLNPLVSKHPQLLADYKTFVAEKSADLPDSALKNFLNDEADPIDTEEQFQNLLDQMIQSFDNLRAFLKKNKDKELTIRGNTHIIPDLIERYAQACVIEASETLVYELRCPPSEKRYDVTINRADFELMENMAALYAVGGALYNAYDLSGATPIMTQIIDNPNVNREEISKQLFQNRKFGLLRVQQKLPNIKSWMVSALSGFQWAMARQSSLCPKGNSSTENRFGFLFGNGICIHPAAKPIFAKFESQIKGETHIDIVHYKRGQTHEFKAYIMNFLDKPVSDLRSLSPLRFNKCNFLEWVADPTLAGIYPDRNANEALVTGIPECTK